MAEKRKRPGSKRGQAKPLKRTLDAGFAQRLKEAIGTREVPEVARAVRCSRAVLHKHLNGGSKTIEALLLCRIADTLKVSERWLLLNQGQRDGLTSEERALVARYRHATDDEKILIRSLVEKISGESAA